jgi:tRNA nucleotidyltransferase (CCA-adding enzyme)
MNLNTVLKRIKPSESEERDMKSFIEKLLDASRKFSKDVKPIICGSVEKETWLSKKYELDLFLMFKPDIDKKELEKRGLDLAKRIIKNLKGKFQIAFAEHPYLRGWVGKFQIDIVPAYEIENPENIKSAVDRTPHHVKFVKKNLRNPDEVRLLKQFCIANKCYGADVKTLGFSGYLCELLVIKYGSFMECVKDAYKWRAGHVITFDNLSREEAIQKFKSPLTVVDPVDKNRNVGAAVSVEKFYTFVKACKDFIENPKEDFFFKKPVKPYSIAEISRKIRGRGTRWFLIAFKEPKVIEDILYPQMKRCSKAIEKMLNQNEFRVLRSDFFCNKECILIFEMETWQTPKVWKNIGPNVHSKHAEEFLKHYRKEVFIEDENWTVESEREFTEALTFLTSLLKKSEKDLLEKGIPSKIAPAIRKGKIIDGDNAIKYMKRLPEDFRTFIREYFEKDLNVV